MTSGRNLGLRVLSAAVLAPPLVLAIFHPQPIWFTAILFAVVAIAQGEFYWIALRDDPPWLRVAGVALGLGVFATALWGTHSSQLLAAVALAMVGCSLLQLFFHRDVQRATANAGLLALGVFYVPVLLATVAQLKRLPQGGTWVILLLTLTWLSDTCAYFVGRALGKHRLYPAISPKKSIEGAVGGLLGALGAAVLAKLWYLPALQWHDVFLISIPGGALGQLGDLVESMFKRSFGVKDSGKILPGHGGLLDRIDAMLFSAPYVYLYAIFVVMTRTGN